jgi:arabinan endo-1,5-alpha-L-arabinosidase
MVRLRLILVVVLASGAALLGARQAPRMLPVAGDVSPVHDPVLARHADAYYLFVTGGRNGRGVLPIRRSPDLLTWEQIGFVFPDALPAWTATEVPRATNAWAPDISFFRGRYHLYYSVSSFGSRDSAIGLVTNRTLDPASPDYAWVDEGMVLRSFADRDDWNAIDPNIVVEDERNVWINWGSFWGGIKMRRIDPATGRLSTTDTTMYALASRDRAQPTNGSIEGSFIVRHGDYWYLFVSFDRCCRGAESTYNIRVGRARVITGPYVDRDGTPMTEGGGTLVLEATTPEWRGPGHNGFLRDGTQDYVAFHAYPAQGRGSRLFISTVVWENGWPRVAALPGSPVR